MKAELHERLEVQGGPQGSILPKVVRDGVPGGGESSH